jgi:hypothetical protein
MSQSGAHVASSFAALAGHFVLQPGQRAAIVGTRPIAADGLLSKLLKGQHFAATQARLGHVFTLCAHAHQRACALAFAAAGQAGSNPASESQPASPTTATSTPPQPLPLALLRWETARDHLRSIALEWPQRIGEPPLQAAAMDWLRTCPLPLAGAAQPSVPQAWSALAALRDWLAQDACFPAQCLARWHAQGKDLAVPLRALNVLSDDTSTQQLHLRQLGYALATQPGFTHSPLWHGACAETGPWTRLRHQRRSASCVQPLSAWTRLEARWQELQDIAAAPALALDASHDPLLSSGAQHLGDGQAIAWCEMARGLLLHWVQLDSHGAVAQYRVLAPTEWNFHPQGALAEALAARAPTDRAAAQTLAAAFDPCVECSVATPPTQEKPHA